MGNRLVRITIPCLVIITLALSMPDALATFYWNLGLVAWNRASVPGKELETLWPAIQMWEQGLKWQQGRPDWLLYLGSAYEQVGDDQKALKTWQQLNQPLDTLIAKGEQYLMNDLPNTALPWFQRASKFAPDVGDPWYYSAQALVNAGQPEEALISLDRALEAARLDKISYSQVYFHKGRIYQWEIHPRRLEEAVEAYRNALALGDFPTTGLETEAHYKLGEVLWWIGKNPDLYITEYQQAIVLDPNHSHAHVLLGVAYYVKYCDVEKAEKKIMLAMEINPQNEWGPMNLGTHVYEPAGMIEEAIEAYQWTLRINPDFEPARQALRRLQE